MTFWLLTCGGVVVIAAVAVYAAIVLAGIASREDERRDRML